MSEPPRRLRFGPFEADLLTGELRKGSTRRHLVGQPFEILALLLERPGELVTREEIRSRLWPDGTFVDFDHGLNAAVNKLRDALGDSAESPSFVETIPRRGYRFIAPIDAPESPSVESTAPPEKKRANRFALGMGLAVAVIAAILVVNGLRSGRVEAPIRSLAVLPFEDLGGDAGEPYFADGMTDAVLSRLAQLGSIRVVSRSSAMRFREKPPPLGEIARQLGVDAVVEGSVLRVAEKVRVSVKLVRTANERTLWSGSFERGLSDVLALQGEIARTVASEIHAQVTDRERWRLSQSRPVDPEAYTSYLRGRFFQRKELAWANERAVESFREALTRDPAWAPAWVALAETEVFRAPPKEVMARAKTAALKALAIDSRLAEAHAALGLTLTYGDHDWAGAEACFRRALALDPLSIDAHHRFSLLLGVLGRFDEALDHGRRAAELDPLSANVLADYGRLFFFARRNDDAVRSLKRALELDPDHPWALTFLGSVYDSEGRFADAMTQWNRLAVVAGVDLRVVAGVDEVFSREGYQAALKRWVGMHATKELSAGKIPIRALVRIGDHAAALAALEDAYAENRRDLIYLNVDPSYDPLRKDPRFVDLLRRVGFAQGK